MNVTIPCRMCLPGWDSLELVAKIHRFFEIGGIFVLLALAFFEFVAYFYGQREQTLSHRRQNAEAEFLRAQTGEGLAFDEVLKLSTDASQPPEIRATAQRIIAEVTDRYFQARSERLGQYEPRWSNKFRDAEGSEERRSQGEMERAWVTTPANRRSSLQKRTPCGFSSDMGMARKGDEGIGTLVPAAERCVRDNDKRSRFEASHGGREGLYAVRWCEQTNVAGISTGSECDGQNLVERTQG
jgi:hypothetical protein